MSDGEEEDFNEYFALTLDVGANPLMGAKYGGAITEFFSDSEDERCSEEGEDEELASPDTRLKGKKKTLIDEVQEVHALYLRTPKKVGSSKVEDVKDEEIKIGDAFDSFNSTFIKQKILLQKPKQPIWCMKPPVPPAFYERFVTDKEAISKGIDSGKYL